MRMLKCYMASDSSGHLVTAGEAMRAPEQAWSCTSCGCLLIHHSGIFGEASWFEHDQQTVPRHVLMQCTHLDPQVKAEARHRALLSIICGLDVPVMAQSWYCVLCGGHYCGEKHCAACGTGIYSIEEASWLMNYT